MKRILRQAALLVLMTSGALAADKPAQPSVSSAAKPAADKSGASSTASTANATDSAKNAAPADAETETLPGGEEGTVFKSLTVTGEDLIRVEFDRPELRLDVDPRSAPGLDWGDSMDVLAESGVDVDAPLANLTTWQACPYRAMPWLSHYRAGAVARFHPQMKDVDRWWLTIADSRSDTLATFQGKGDPPKEIAWDGRARNGSLVAPGITCSYVLEAIDRAGNRRSFVGPGFDLPSYRVRTRDAEVLLFSGSELGDIAALTDGAAVPAPILLETASWLNQIEPSGGPIEVHVSARSSDQARRLGDGIVAALTPRVIGDRNRVRTLADVRPDAPLAGSVTVNASLTPR